MNPAARARRARDEADSPDVQAKKARAARAISGPLSAWIVAADLSEAQGVAFTLREYRVRIMTARHATHGAALDGVPGPVFVHPSARRTRYASELDEVLAGLRARGVVVQEVKA